MIFERVLVLLVAVEASSRRVKNSGRVVNGEDANIADFPFYGALAPKRSMFIDREKTHLAVSCGSSLIAPQFFITAYHCFLRHADPMYWVVIMNVRDRCRYDGSGRVVEVSWIYKHPEGKISNNAKMNDIALMLVSKPITDVTPLSLPMEPPKANEKGYIIGFGLSKITSPEGDIKDMACKPQKALQYVPDQTTCLKPKETIVGAFCIKDVSNKEAAACRGDSGGPYVVLRDGKRFLLGLSSFGDKLCKPSSNSDHFTNVYNYVEWINKVLHEPLPEGFKRIQENIQQFEPVGGHERANEIRSEPAQNRYTNKANRGGVVHVLSSGRMPANDGRRISYAHPNRMEVGTRMFRQPVMSYRTISITGPRPALMPQMSANPPQRFSNSVQMVAAPNLYKQPVLSVNTVDTSGPGPAPLPNLSGNQPQSFSVVNVGQNPIPEHGNMQQFQYAQQQASVPHLTGNWVTLVNHAPANPNTFSQSIMSANTVVASRPGSARWPGNSANQSQSSSMVLQPGHWVTMVNNAPVDPIVMANGGATWQRSARSVQMSDYRMPSNSMNSIMPYQMPQSSFMEGIPQPMLYGMGQNNHPQQYQIQSGDSLYPLRQTVRHLPYPAYSGRFFGYT